MKETKIGHWTISMFEDSPDRWTGSADIEAFGKRVCIERLRGDDSLFITHDCCTSDFGSQLNSSVSIPLEVLAELLRLNGYVVSRLTTHEGL